MQELDTILRRHAVRYPQMEVCDAVKLIYQNEFGAAHLITDEAACRAALQAEYLATTHNSDALRCEKIGNGIARVHLAALTESELDTLGSAFLACANERRGSEAQFREKLAVLTELAREGIFGFSPTDLRAYLHAYECAGFPAVSHSETYRAAYRPAYRIVCLPFPPKP